MKSWIFIFALLGWFSPHAAAEELKEPYKEIISQKQKEADELDEDGIFSGITVKDSDGNTTMRSGTLIGVDPAALRGRDGRIPREVLPYLTRSVVYVSSGDASVSSSTTHSSSHAGISSSGINLGSNSSNTEANTAIPSGMTITKHE